MNDDDDDDDASKSSRPKHGIKAKKCVSIGDEARILGTAPRPRLILM